MKYSFRNDYGNIGHKKILETLIEHAEINHVGYSTDEITNELEQEVKRLTDHDVNIHIVVGGTLTNLVIISKILKPYEGIISVETGHINTHETGAVEGTGHKIITVKGYEGKVTPKDVEYVMNNYTDCHLVLPRMVYISNSTEIGTIYNKEELSTLYATCKKYGLYLFLDGARLPIALTSSDNDMSIIDITEYTDIYYIGGAKNGLPLGEMIVIKDKKINENFKYHIKNRGAMVSKGFFLSYMFIEYLKDNFYLELAQNSNDMARYLRNKLIEKNIEIVYPNNTNQIFVRLTNEKIKELLKKFDFEIWETGDEYTVVRLVTSWNTNKDLCDYLIEDIG